MEKASIWIIIDENKRILLIKRSNYTKNFPHYWTIPWWRWTDSETLEEIVIREVKEETGLNFKPIKLYNKSWEINFWEANRFLWTWEWKINIQEEEADWYAWYTYEETKKLKIAFNYRETIEHLFRDWLIK